MFFFQLVIMSGTVLLAYYMECTDLFSVHVQGFFCNDAELMKPYPGTEESSFVPPLILYCVVAAAPTAIVSKKKKNRKREKGKKKREAVLFVISPQRLKTVVFLGFHGTRWRAQRRSDGTWMCFGSVSTFSSFLFAFFLVFFLETPN